VSVISNQLTTFGRGRPFGGVQRVKKKKVIKKDRNSTDQVMAVRTFLQSRSGVRSGRAELVCGGDCVVTASVVGLSVASDCIAPPTL
jgi:hypothetical protein